jgi:hypothetical protein
VYASLHALQPAIRSRLTQFPDVGRHTVAILSRYPELEGVMEGD